MNINAARKLLEKYQSITLDELTVIWLKLELDNEEIKGKDVLAEITGFGCMDTCMLCKEAKTFTNDIESYCNHCIYSIHGSPSMDMFCLDNTYHAIADARNEKQLFNAIQNRIKYLKEIIDSYENCLCNFN